MTMKKESIQVKVKLLKSQLSSSSHASIVNMEISILNTGIRVPQWSLDDLFCDFNNLSGDGNQIKNTSMLGLSISKKIIESMGGSVKVKSRFGLGTEFIINLQATCNVSKEIQPIRQHKSQEIAPLDSSLSQPGDMLQNKSFENQIHKHVKFIIFNKRVDKYQLTTNPSECQVEQSSSKNDSFNKDIITLRKQCSSLSHQQERMEVKERA